MNRLIKGTFLVSFGLLGLISASEVQAQTPTNIDISDQARFVENLETRRQSEWTFGVGGQNEALVEDSAEFNELEDGEKDLELVTVDEEFEDWEDTGDDESLAVVVEVYDF